MYLGSTTTTTEVSIRKISNGELEENVMINAFLPNAVLAEMVSNLEPNQVILRRRSCCILYG
jgi:hypothetical protein